MKLVLSDHDFLTCPYKISAFKLKIWSCVEHTVDIRASLFEYEWMEKAVMAPSLEHGQTGNTGQYQSITVNESIGKTFSVCPNAHDCPSPCVSSLFKTTHIVLKSPRSPTTRHDTRRQTPSSQHIHAYSYGLWRHSRQSRCSRGLCNWSWCKLRIPRSLCQHWRTLRILYRLFCMWRPTILGNE